MSRMFLLSVDAINSTDSCNGQSYRPASSAATSDCAARVVGHRQLDQRSRRKPVDFCGRSALRKSPPARRRPCDRRGLKNRERSADEEIARRILRQASIPDVEGNRGVAGSSRCQLTPTRVAFN